MLVIVAIAKLKYNGKRKASANLKEYKAIKEAEKLWEHCLEEEQNIWELEANNWRQTEKYQKDTELYFGVGEDKD